MLSFFQGPGAATAPTTSVVWPLQPLQRHELRAGRAVLGGGPKYLLPTLGVIYLLFTGSKQVLAYFISPYALQAFAMPPQTAALVSAALWCGVFVGRVATVLVAMYWPSSVWTVFFWSILSCAGVASVALACCLLGASGGLWLLAAGFSVCMAPVYPTGLTVPAEEGVLDSSVHLVVMMLCGAIGEMLFPAVVGVWFEEHPDIFPTVIAASAVTSCALLLPWVISKDRLGLNCMGARHPELIDADGL